MSVGEIDVNDPDILTYMTSLHSSLIDAFSSITLDIENFSEAVQNGYFQLIPQILEFLVKCLENKFTPALVSA